MNRTFLGTTTHALAALAFAAGCSAGTDADTTSGDGDAGAGGAGSSTSASAATGSTGSGFATGGGSQGGGDPGPEIAEVFGHSDTTLYRLDPITKAVTTVGEFSGCAQVIDIALDADSQLFGTTSQALVRIDKTTAACTTIAAGGYPNSLSFVPAGTLLPNEEALVGYLGDQYVRIDAQSGAITNVGAPWGNGLQSSGDVVSVKNGKSFLTVNGGACGDCLVEIDPATGALVKNWGSIGYPAVYGIAFWAGSVYGFASAGQLFEVTFDGGVLATELVAQPSNTKFWGAGSTTSAPPDPIPE